MKDGADLLERLLARGVRDPATGCLRWPGAPNANGYGRVHVGPRATSRSWYIHRLAWTLTIGPIPDGLEIDHVAARGCQHRDCFEVAHLELVDHATNVRRGGRAVRTHCPHGHPLDRVRADGRRWCSTCDRARPRSRDRRKGA